MIGILGIIVLLGIAFIMSNNRNNINYRIVFWGMGLQIIFALFILKTPIGKPLFGFFDKVISKLISFS
ncbi:MAG: NupC/NupG family nucleoside CNT transporter, partial [Candidatus Marinimicrobia bacterium]|nr:NupC/NupG family nucleoside CNT transporter [Candidatus Neomarinimicrobiota bacterium]